MCINLIFIVSFKSWTPVNLLTQHAFPWQAVSVWLEKQQNVFTSFHNAAMRKQSESGILQENKLQAAGSLTA